MNNNNQYENKTTDDIGENRPILAKAMKIAKFKEKFGASRMIKFRNSVSEDKGSHYAPFKISK